MPSGAGASSGLTWGRPFCFDLCLRKVPKWGLCAARTEAWIFPSELLLDLLLKAPFPLEVLDSLLEGSESPLLTAAEGDGSEQEQINVGIRLWWLCREQEWKAASLLKARGLLTSGGQTRALSSCSK